MENCVKEHIKAAISTQLARIRRGKKVYSKEGYWAQASRYVTLAELYLQDTGVNHNKAILLSCERAADAMDAYLREDYNVTDLLTTYVEGYKASIRVLLSYKTRDAIALGIDLCERLGRRISAEKSDVNKNVAILEIALLNGALQSAQCAHESAIESYELAERIMKMQIRSNDVVNANIRLAECYLQLVVEHVPLRSLEHYEATMDCYLKAICLYTNANCKEKKEISIDSIFAIKHDFADVFGQYRNASKHVIVLHRPFLGNDFPYFFKQMIDDDFDDLKKQAKTLLSRDETITITECVAALKTYEGALSSVLGYIERSEEKNKLLRMKKNCFTLISDLLLDKGDFYESKRYADLASSMIAQ